MTYSIEPAPEGTVCDECGAPAVVKIEADYMSDATGYVDSINLCEECDQKELEKHNGHERD